MADNSIMSIAKTVMQAKANVQAASSAKESDENDFSMNLMELMSQNQLQTTTAQQTESSVDQISANVQSEQPTYDSYTNKTSISQKEDMTAEKMQTENSEQLEEFAEDVYQKIEEEFGVSEEEIAKAMEELGLVPTDLMNPQNLMQLITVVTGQDAGSLLLSENFQNLMQEVTVLTEELASELGITKEQLLALGEELKQQMLDTLADEEIQTAIETVEDIQQSDNTVTETSQQTKTTETVQTVVEKQQVSSETEVEETAEETDDVKVQTEIVENPEDAEMTEDDTAQGNEQKLGQKNEHVANDHSNVQTAAQQDGKIENFSVQKAAVPVYASNINVVDIIEQIAKNVRVNVSAGMTSMEMQLNPENLGKVYLHISEQDGAIRAQLTAQNEVVKEALETQMVLLRQELSQQGIKVDAIEVTVATHEFEQNLEGEAKQEEQLNQQMEENKKKTTRSLNLNDLDGLTGLMSEEEELVAKIMRDNGNQVDYTA